MHKTSDITTYEFAGYPALLAEAQSLFAGERNLLANAANCAAMLFTALFAVNWAGFYFREGDDLLVGPFQGKPACIRIPHGKGVCGAAAARRQTLIVADVHQFPGHIACDAASRSEIVVPLLYNGRVIGVLDIDSPALNRFSESDRAGLEAICAALLAASDCTAAGYNIGVLD